MTFFKGSPKYTVQHRCSRQQVKTYRPESFSSLQNQLTRQYGLKGDWKSHKYKTYNKRRGATISLESGNDNFGFVGFWVC